MSTTTTRNALVKPGYSDAADVGIINTNMDTIDASFAKCNWAGTVDPTTDEDSVDGYSKGSFWFNTTGHKLFIAEAVTVGAAVWRTIYPGGVSPVISASDPTANDDSGDGYAIGQIWYNTTGNKYFVAKDVTVGAAVWVQIPTTGTAWDIGAVEIRALTFQSDIATGTAPFTVASTTQVANLNAASAGNADTLDTLHAASFPLLAGLSGGQTLNGGTGASENLTLSSTSNGTKGYVAIPGGNLTLGTKATTSSLGFKIHEGAAGAPNPITFLDADGTTAIAAIFKDSSDNLSFASGDGTTADAYIQATTGKLIDNNGISTTLAVTDPAASATGWNELCRPQYTGAESASETWYNFYNSCFPEIQTGHTNTGNIYAFYNETMRNHNAAGTDDDGTLTALYAIQCFYGHYSSNASMKGVTTYADGLRIVPYCAKGTISNSFCIEITTGTMGGTLTADWGIYDNHAGNNYYGATYNRFQSTTGDRVIYVVQTSTTDPIADAWNTHSNEKYKNDLGAIDSDIDRSARYQARKAIADRTLHTWTRKSDLEDPAHYEAMFPLEDDRPRGPPGEEIPAKDLNLRLAEQDYRIYNHIEECKTLKKFQKPNIGLFAEEAPEEIVSYGLDGKPEGIDLGAYIGWVHRAVDALHYDVDSLEVTVADMDYLLWEQDAINYELTVANAELELRVKNLESKNAALLKKHDDSERRMALLEQRLSKLEQK
jgi:hypothetical protein